jgi:hypothetical protein
MTFGYNADIAFNYSSYGIRDHALKLLTAIRDKRDEYDVRLSLHLIYDSLQEPESANDSHDDNTGNQSSTGIRLPQSWWHCH